LIPLQGRALDFLEKRRSKSASAARNLSITLPVDVPLSNEGGLITLLDASGLKVHGVSYTKAQALRQGWTVVF